MIELTKLNGDPIIINSKQIECIEVIPESKIMMMNGRFHIVSEGKEEIMTKVIRFSSEIRNAGVMEV